MSTFTELRGARDLFANLTLRELRSKYKRSFLGWSWSLLNPLATMAIFTIVFAKLLRITPEPGDPSGLDVFALFLLCGLLPWNFLSNGMTGGMGALVGNANLVRKVWFPRETLVAANVASWLVSLAIELAVLLVALLVAGNMVLPWIPVLLLLIALQCAFVLGIALVLSVFNVYFRDTQHLLGIVLQIWFYATPIVYPVSQVRGSVSTPVFRLYEANPMFVFVESYRDVLYDLRFPPLWRMLAMAGYATVALVVGVVVFRRLEPKLAEEL
jgi:ABC-2 type transport system permease protein